MTRGDDRVVMLDAESLAMIGHFGGDHQDGTHDVDFEENASPAKRRPAAQSAKDVLEIERLVL